MSTSKSQSNINNSLSEEEEDNRRILRLRNVYKEYNQDNGNHLLSSHIILNNLNLDIKEGEFVTIVGPSGCAKSTLLNLLSGLDTSFK